ncbi:MAG: LCP family protein, partial [Oscillospiraceae bacterium]|nr:LCP family protein [Oscillospiraceae bacterium]
LSINGLTGKVSMVSILRDCYVEVPGHGKTKLNHAHAYAGPALTVQTIERNFRIKIHGVVTLSMDSLPEIVQNMGGVTIEITAAEAKILTSLGGDKFEAGVQFLPPYAAAYFTRIRAIDSDFGRTDRQRRMMLAMVDECKRMGPGRLLKFIQSSAPYVASNMSDISIGWFGLRLGLGMVVGSPNQEAVPWSDAYSGKMVGNMSVVALDLPENVRRLHKLLYIF